MMNHGTLEHAIDEMVRGCGLDPAVELGARVKLAVCELYEAVPPGFEKCIDVVVRHDQTCASVRGAGDCTCKRTVEIGFPDAGEPVIVH